MFGEGRVVTGSEEEGLGVDGGVMKTVYGPILPMTGGGGEDSVLIDIAGE